MPDSDRYVIVYRNGVHGQLLDRGVSDMWLHYTRLGGNPPAYRVRIREKAKPRAFDKIAAGLNEAIAMVRALP